MTDLAQKIADAVEVALGDDGHCIVYKSDAVRDAIRTALTVAQGEAVDLEKLEALGWQIAAMLVDKDYVMPHEQYEAAHAIRSAIREAIGRGEMG